MPFLNIESTDVFQDFVLSTEWIAWASLLLVVKLYVALYPSEYSRLHSRDRIEAAQTAFLIVLATVCSSLVDVSWYIPLITPALYFVLRQNPTVAEDVDLDSEKCMAEDPRPRYSHLRLISYTFLAMLTTISFMPPEISFADSVLASVFLVCQTAIYAQLTEPTSVDLEVSTRQESLGAMRTLVEMEPMVEWVLAFLSIIILVTPQQLSPQGTLFVSGILKGLLWVAIIFLCKDAQSINLTSIATFAICTIHLTFVPCPLHAIGACLASLIALLQIHFSFPASCASRRVILIFALLPLGVLAVRLGSGEWRNEIWDTVDILEGMCRKLGDVRGFFGSGEAWYEKVSGWEALGRGRIGL